MLVLVFSILNGADLPFILAIVVLTALPMALFYRFFKNFLAEQRAERQKEAAGSAKA